MGYSKRQVAIRLCMDTQWVDVLLTREILQYLPGGTPLRRKISAESLDLLVEGEHFVICPNCHKKLGQLVSKHTMSCCGLSLSEFLTLFPNTRVLCDLVSRSRAKTPEARLAQSQKLTSRFLTPEGEVTRAQISIASKRMHENGYRDIAVGNLRRWGRDPANKERKSRVTRERWASGDLRGVVADWHRDNRELSLELSRQARRHNTRKFTKPHQRLKSLMEESGLSGFKTELEVGYYALDEGNLALKIDVEMMGCYWHSCSDCGLSGPKHNLSLDRRKKTYLTNLGWSVIYVWEHELKRDPQSCLDRIHAVVRERQPC